MLKLFNRSRGFILAFFLPLLLLGGVLAIWKVYPFGPRSILMGDEYNQYIQFYNYYYDVLKEGHGSLLYSWEAGMGLNFWATFAYYLSSPVSFVTLLFNRDHLPEAFVFMLLVKIGLSGLMMNIFLSKMYKVDKLTTLIFSTLYSLIAFSIGYFFNIMWLDSVYMLPIVLLGMEYLFKKRYMLLIISLSILFVSNFYMAYIVGMFTFLYFLFRSISFKKTTIKNFLFNACTFIICTIIAGGISAVITLPTYLLLKSNGSQQSQLGDFFTSSLGFFELLTKFYSSSGNIFTLPNVYSGLVVLLLFPLFFINPKIRSKEKIAYFIFIMLIIMSFQINGLNLIWHAFSAPTGYYERFAFVLSFLLIFLSFRSYLVFEKESIPSLAKVYLGNVFLLIMLTKFAPDLMSINKVWVNILFLTVFSLLLYEKAVSIKSNRIIPVFILLFVCLDLGLNSYQHLKTLSNEVGYNIPRNQYNADPSFEKMVNELKSQDASFYRTNSLVRLTSNDSFRFGYKGMTNFNTLSNGTLHSFMEAIGYSSTLGARSLTQNQGILSSDSLLGFKYLLSDKPVKIFGYDNVKKDNGIYLYKNNFAMPIGFMMDAKIFTFNNPMDNPFEKQNQLLGPSDRPTNFFEPLHPASVSYNNLTATTQGNILYVKKNDPQKDGSIDMVFNIHGSQQFYTLLSAGKGFPGFNETTIYVNGTSLGVYPTYHKEGVFDLGAYSNEKVTVKISFAVPSTQLSQQLFYGLNIPGFDTRINELRNETLDVTNWTETSIEGKINVKTKDSLFLSIPYDKGWKAAVDGKSVPIIKLGGFIGVNLAKGKHTIALSYLPDGLKTGGIISIASLLILLVVFLYLRRKSVPSNTLGE